MIESVRVRPPSAPRLLARPKSVTLGVPSAVSRMLAGFRSRWTIPRAWAWCTAIGERLDQPGRGARAPRPAVEPVRQAAAVDVLHFEIRPALVVADPEDLDHLRVLEPGDGLGFLQEPRPRPRGPPDRPTGSSSGRRTG